MKVSPAITLSLLLAILLTSCRKSEPETMVTFSYDGDKFRYVFNMPGEIINLALKEGDSRLHRFRFVVRENEWVEFAVNEEKKWFTYQAHFAETPNYKFDFAPAAGHRFWQADPETQYISKFLNTSNQSGTVHWQ